jgi:hypothetical protein
MNNLDIEKTIIVCGATHTGTSLIAGTLHLLNIPMGKLHSTEVCYEDRAFALPFFHESMLIAIEARNSEHNVWGFKFPFMRNWFLQVFPYLRNPCFIFCTRDSLERARLKPEKYDNFLMHIDLCEEQAFWERFFFQNPSLPRLVVPFGQKKELLLTKLCSFLSLEPSEEALIQALSFNKNT